MTQTKLLRKARSLTAAVVGSLFLFSTVATPLVEANFWEQRRDASRRANGQGHQNSALLARLPGSMGPMDGVLPAVNGALGTALQSAPPIDLNGLTTPADVRASSLPSWLRGLPSSAGEIRDVALAKNAETAPVVVLVQDVHNVLSAQKNIAEIVSHIESAAARDNRGPVLIGLEGGVGAFDIKRFRAFRGNKGHRLASELLLKTNIISGPEYYAFQSDREPLLWGIETREDYMENAEAVRGSAPATERVTAAVAAAQRAVDVKGEAVFSKELKELNRVLAAHANGSATVVDLVRGLRERVPKVSAPEVDKLQKALNTESTLDFAKVERERTALIEILVRTLDAPSVERLVNASLSYRSNQISFGTYHAQLKELVKGHGIRWSDYPAFDRYVQYVLLAESIDKFRLFDELEDLKRKAVAATGRTEEEKTVMGLAEDLRLVNRLVRHEFGPAEWKAYSTHKNDLSRLPSRMAEVLGALAVAGPSKEDLALFERFYVAASRRNDSLAANLLAKAKESDAKIMVLVAGGFHTPELESRLKAKGLSVVTITPAIGEIPKGPNYLDIFLVKNIPLEQFLQGEKLYFSPPRINAGAGLLLDSPVTPEAEERIFGAAEVAATLVREGKSEVVNAQLRDEIPRLKIETEVGSGSGNVSVTANTIEGKTTVLGWTGDQVPSSIGNETRGIVVQEGQGEETLNLALRTGVIESPQVFSIRARFMLLFRSFSTVLATAAKKVAPWVSQVVNVSFQRTRSVLTPVGTFFQGFQGGRSFTEILGDWFYSLMSPFQINVVPNGKTSGNTEFSQEDLARLKKELLDPNNVFFDLPVLAASYGISVESMTTLLRKLGQEKSLLLPTGGWTSLLTIDRPDGAKGDGPFISRFQEVHRQGFSHDSVVVLAVTPDGRLILQHRKDNNQFDVGASGHVDIGETPIVAASHELAEELGLDARSGKFSERLVPIPNPDRESGTFLKEGGQSFSEFLYQPDSYDFFGPSKETNNKEKVHLFTILLTEEEVRHIERIGTKVSGSDRLGVGYLPLQFLLDVQRRMAEAAGLMAKLWNPLAPRVYRPMQVSDQEVDRVEIVNPLDLVQMSRPDGGEYASSLRHFFQGEKIRTVVTGYLRGLLSAEKLGQDLGRAALTDSKNRKTVYGMTLITGHPFSPNGVVHNVVGALREGLVVVSNNKIPDLGKKSHATLAPLVRSKKTEVSIADLTGVDLNEVLAALAETAPMTFELEELTFGDLKDGSVILTLREVSEGALQGLRERLSVAGLPFKFEPAQTGNRMYVQVALIGPEAFAKMSDAEIGSVIRWMEFHRDLKKWWVLHREFLKEKQKKKADFPQKEWLEKQIGHSVDDLFFSIWQMESMRLVGRFLVEPQEVMDHVVLATYNNRKLSGLVSQGITLPLGVRSEEFPERTALIEQVAAVQSGLDYHSGRLQTDPVSQDFRPSKMEDATYLRDLPVEETDRLARIGLEHINNGTFAILAAGAASRMANEFHPKALELLKEMWNKSDPPRPRGKASLPIAKIKGGVFSFMDAFFTNVNAMRLRLLRFYGKTLDSPILVYSNRDYVNEQRAEIEKNSGFGIPMTKIDTSLLQKLRPQFGGSVEDVMQMQAERKFKSPQAYLVALEKARELEEKLSRGEGEAALLMEEKAPHGHGEFLHDFVAEGKVLEMIDQHREWIFVRNVDNVAATVDYNFLVTLGLFHEKGLDFQAEVSPRLPGMKGGALIVTKAGQTVLTEGPSFAATWSQVEKELGERGYAPLDDTASREYVDNVFQGGSTLILAPTRMDFTGSILEARDVALQAVGDDEIRVYRNSSGKTIAIRHVVPESTYWFNNATGLFSPRYFYFVYRRDENQTFEEFIKEMRQAVAQNQGGLQAISQRGKSRFPILLDAKPTKTGGVGQKPETNMWQSSQVASAAGAKIGAVGVDSLRTTQENLWGLRFLATKQIFGPIESYDSNFDLFSKVIEASWDPENLIPSRLSSNGNHLSINPPGASKQGGFLNLDIFSGIMQNKWARQALAFILLLLIAPAAFAAPEVALTFAANAAGADGGGIALVIGAAGAVIFGAIKSIGTEKTLFEQTGREPLGETLIPRAREQLSDLKSTIRSLGELSANDRMVREAGNLTDAVGALVPSQAQAVYADHAVRATLLAALAAKREAGVALYADAKRQIMDSLRAFGDVLFGSETSASIQTKLTSLGELADVNPDNIVVVDQVQPGVPKTIHVDETSDRAKILNLVEMLERYSSVGAQKDLMVPGTGLMITLAHGMESGENADLIKRLKELGEKATEAGLPINVHQGSAIGDGILNINSDGMVVVNVLAVLKLLNINPNQANLKIQLIASPTSTVVFNTEGLPRTVLVEKIKWLLEGIGLRISSEQTENEIRSLIAALKAA